MPRDTRVDDYIARQSFGRPILEHLREVVHAACPEAEEAIKWGMPHFLYKGEHLAMMAAFKAHASFGFWRGSLVVEGAGAKDSPMGQFGKLRSVDDLPDAETLTALIHKAMSLADAGVKPPRDKTVKAPIAMPDDFRVALDAVPAAAAAFAGFSPAARREYLEWITGAKQSATRQKRVKEATGWIAEGKKRNWKYDKC